MHLKRWLLTRKCRAMLSRGEDVDRVLVFLRQRGCDKIDSIIILSEAQGLTRGEAKVLVHLSKAWSDVYENDEALHDTAEAAARSESIGQGVNEVDS